MFSLLSRRPYVAPFPFAVSAETVRGCNLACSGCPAGMIGKHNIAFMPYSVFCKAIDELSPNTFYLQLWFQGEPLLHNGLEDFIRYARTKGMFTVVATNGLLLTEEISRMLLRSGLNKLIVSADAGSALYPVGGNYNSSQNNIARMVQMKRDARSRFPLVEAQMVVTSDNEDKMDEFRTAMKGAGADKITCKSAWFDDLSKPDLPVPKTRYRYVKNADGSWRTRKAVRNRCKRIFSTMVIGFNGDVMPCCFDKKCQWVLGNIKEENAGKVWRGNAFNLYRSELLLNRKQKNICLNCTE